MLLIILLNNDAHYKIFHTTMVMRDNERSVEGLLAHAAEVFIYKFNNTDNKRSRTHQCVLACSIGA